MQFVGPASPPGGGEGAVLDTLSGVARLQGLPDLAGRLADLRRFLTDDVAQLEAGIAALFAGDRAAPAERLPAELPGTRVRGAARHLLQRPGKRIRPLCVLLAARLGGRHLDPTLRHVATACELVHAATLLHDDVIDDSNERRGAVAARIQYGNSASILAGDHLLVYALQLVVGEGHGWLTDSLLQVMAGMVAAEALQLERRGRFEPRRDLYLQVIRGKTAALFAWGLQAGGRLAQLSHSEVEALGKVGMHLGMAFQLVDDSLDMAGDPDVIGKDVMRDVRDGKVTWPIILASEQQPALCEPLQKLAAAAPLTATDEALQAVLQAIEQTGALEQTRQFAGAVAADALAALHELPASPAREALEVVIRSAVDRST